jgi:hypothetical protein
MHHEKKQKTKNKKQKNKKTKNKTSAMPSGREVWGYFCFWFKKVL